MEKSKIIKKEGNKITLQLEIELDPNSMLNSEEQIAEALNEAGIKASKEALEQFDSDGLPIEINSQVFTSKGKVKKNINSPMEKKK